MAGIYVAAAIRPTAGTQPSPVRCSHSGTHESFPSVGIDDFTSTLG